VPTLRGFQVLEHTMRRFFDIRKDPLDRTGLTELNAAQSVDRGFVTHADWIAHVTRYGHVSDEVVRRKPHTILDVGSGKLNLAYFLWRNRRWLTHHHVAVDQRARESWLDVVGKPDDNKNIDLIRMDIIHDELPDEVPNKYPMVVCLETFEHVPVADQQTLLNNLRKWTEPGGRCYFSTPNLGGSDSVAQNHIGPDGVRERTYADKVEMVKQAGFDLVESYGTFATLKRVPQEIFEDPTIAAAKKYLPSAFFRGLIAAAYPAVSNNALMVLEKPAW
jgi:2-polyprenyl-3-methyl-5-hydroxy-6-metoxy-1,4-benzoquinol methylase